MSFVLLSDKLDGLMKKRRHSDDEIESARSIEFWLTSHMPEDYARRRPTAVGQKRVGLLTFVLFKVKLSTLDFEYLSLVEGEMGRY